MNVTFLKLPQLTAESCDEDQAKTDQTIHTANVSTVSEATEEIVNIGSMHVLGHQANQHTMTVVNGVVQGKILVATY